MTNSERPSWRQWWDRYKGLVSSILVIIFFIAISVVLFIYGRRVERLDELKNYGYLGAFIISVIGNASILFPVATLPILSAIGGILYPVTGLSGPIFVGLLGGAGAGIGEIAGYMAGYSGHGIIKNNKVFLKFVEWMKRWGGLAIFVSAMVPFFFDVTGLAAGAARFPLWKFVLLVWLGRTINYVTFVLLISVWGFDILLRFFE